MNSSLGSAAFRAVSLIVEVARLELDRRAVRGAFAGMLPRVAGARQLLRVGQSFGSDDALERVEPVMIVGLAGVWIAGGLRLLDLLAERRRPFRPGERTALVQRHGKRKGL